MGVYVFLSSNVVELPWQFNEKVLMLHCSLLEQLIEKSPWGSAWGIEISNISPLFSVCSILEIKPLNSSACDG